MLLTENDIRYILKECVNRIVLAENQETYFLDVERRLANGEDPKDVFDSVYDYKNGYARVTLRNKQNLINTNGEIVSKQWFDWVDYFKNGYAQVKLNDRYNYIDVNGNTISRQGFDFDWVDDFENGYARVYLNDKYNLIDTDGNLISKQWFDTPDKLREFSDR